MEKYSLGIEFGSTRIKAVLINEFGKVIQTGDSLWENKLVGGYWSYSKEEILSGLKECINHLYEKLDDKQIIVSSLGISAMMHGYIVLDENDNLLTPFRTWRNTSTKVASEELSSLFQFNIPERWSVAHLYQAILNKEEHINKISYITTLAGYVHYLLTGNKVLGMDDASGMFPLDENTKNYDENMVQKFNVLLKDNNLPYSMKDIFPKVLNAGETAGKITLSGLELLNNCPLFQVGTPLCPPEGDAGTGMIATNTIAKNTGNISVGTSIFLMAVLSKKLTNYYKEIDVVCTPDGLPVAMVHANNCSSEINHWMDLLYEANAISSSSLSKNDFYSLVIKEALNSDNDSKNIIYYNFLSGEPVVNVNEAKPLLVRLNDAKMSLANFIKSQLYSAFSSVAIGMEILKKEDIHLDYIFGHGGLFKSKDVVAPMVSSFLSSKVAITSVSSEGGPYGMALLANYIFYNENTLEEYLNKINPNDQVEIFEVDNYLEKEIKEYLNNYKENLHLVGGYIKDYSDEEIKKRVYEANMRLYESGLAPLTWGNASEIDRQKGIIAIKPSGVPYEKMRPEDIVITDLDGNVIKGKLKPSSDLKTHVELYKKFPTIGGVVHTHSPYATSFAQAGVPIEIYGTTHADSFYGDIPLARSLTKTEIDDDYEKNTGVVIVETFEKLDYEAVPGVIVHHHGPFTWGKDANKAVENAIVLEKVAQMNFQTLLINKEASKLEEHIKDKHYYRKHGKNAYYGQGETK